jgi:hypothetical protein
MLHSKFTRVFYMGCYLAYSLALVNIKMIKYPKRGYHFFLLVYIPYFPLNMAHHAPLGRKILWVGNLATLSPQRLASVWGTTQEHTKKERSV